MEHQFEINRLTEFSVDTANALRHLAQQLGENYQELTDADVKEMIDSPMHNLFVAQTKDGQIVGMVLLLVYRIPYLRKAYLDDLTVDSEFRGKGIGTRLLDYAIAYAKSAGAAYVDFTSKPERESGNRLYAELGFQKRETNLYRKVFTYGKNK